jgi:3-hydroxyacyl-CoA dehydrogenase/enoyl-CoA hydratase/3-hydroxybutyryl-CoA epimerase
MSSTSKNLVHVFHLQEKLKNLASKHKNKIKRVHVIGAGTMGGDIAAWCAFRGFEVTLQDQAPALLASAIKRAAKLAASKKLEKHLAQSMMDRLVADPQGLGLKRADMIIEAITEKLEAKQQLFKHIESVAKSDAVFATNTSTIPIEEIATALSNQGRLVGFHFFNPVAKLPLVEIVQARKTDRSVLERAMIFARALDKLPLPVKSSPGFLVNRILLPYMLEAMILLEEGVAMEVIDQAAVNFGMPVGPIELADKVGLDICLAAGEKMAAYFDKTVPARLKNLVAEGHLGCKTGSGFYQYKNGKLQKQKTPDVDPTLSQSVANRLILKMVHEALACLKEGIVNDPDFIDAGSIFGFGFAPFRGGLMTYIDSQQR